MFFEPPADWGLIRAVKGSDRFAYRAVSICRRDTGEHILSLAGLKGIPSCTALAPDGNTVAAFGSLGTLIVWDLDLDSLLGD